MMLRVLDEARSVDFYQRAFGLAIADRFAFDSFTLVYLRNAEADFEIELTINHGRTEPYSLGDGYGHVAFAVDDLAAEHARFTAEELSPTPVKEFFARRRADGPLLLRAGSRRLQDRGFAEARPLSLERFLESALDSTLVAFPCGKPVSTFPGNALTIGSKKGISPNMEETR